MNRPSCHLIAASDEQGGIAVTVVVPTYEGGATFHITVERDNDGDWRVSIPWPDEVTVDDGAPVSFGDHESVSGLIDGMEVTNGILYLGAPDEVLCKKCGEPIAEEDGIWVLADHVGDEEGPVFWAACGKAVQGQTHEPE